MDRLQAGLTGCVELLQEYRGLMESQSTASYVQGQLECVDSAWLRDLETLTYEELVHLPEHTSLLMHTGLQHFIQRVVSLYPQYQQWTEELHPTALEVRDMTPKKVHEVSRLSAFIAHIASETKVTDVVDLGAGLGYLSHFLACRCSLSVLAVESKVHNSHASRTRSDYISSKTQQSGDFQAVSLHVTDSNFATLCEKPCLLVGLHTCGDLAPVSLRMAAAVPTVRAVVNVGCCYNLLSETIAPEAKERFSQYFSRIGVNLEGKSLDQTFVSGPNAGFPMSAYLRSRYPAFYLGRMARTLAQNDFSDQMMSQPAENMRKFSFRAAFQCLLGELFPHLSSTYAVGKTKFSTNFAQYVRKASKNMHIQISLSDEELEAIYTEKYRPMEKKAAGLWVLRTLLAPVVEHLLVCDRAIYLQEQGLETSVWQVFDREVSPRCTVLMGVKPAPC